MHVEPLVNLDVFIGALGKSKPIRTPARACPDAASRSNPSSSAMFTVTWATNVLRSFAADQGTEQILGTGGVGGAVAHETLVDKRNTVFSLTRLISSTTLPMGPPRTRLPLNKLTLGQKVQ